MGRVATFKLLPSGQGYSVQLAGVANMDDKVVAICPIEVQTGREAGATGPIVAGLREGKQVDGVLVAGMSSLPCSPFPFVSVQY